MYLTNEEERILKGDRGEEKRIAMEILVALGKIYGASRLIPVKSAQISGISYKSIGEAGIRWLRSLSKARVVVPTTLNPAGMDLERWRFMGIHEDFARKQLEIIGILRGIGAEITCTCTPYLAGNRPSFGDHLAWAESSAVCYANSVIGARTNREGGPSALAAAIIGKTPLYGYHLDENRRATFKVRVLADLKDMSDFGALGYWTGALIKSGLPYFSGIKEPDDESLKALGAALAASSNASMYHVEGMTPEFRMAIKDEVEKVEFTNKDLAWVYDELTTFRGKKVDLVAIGCPHASLKEMEKIANMLAGKRIANGIKLWIFTSRAVRRTAERIGYIRAIQSAGGEVYADCCMVVSPIEKLGFESIAVNSAKAAFYLRAMSGIDVVFGSLKRCIDIALRGRL